MEGIKSRIWELMEGAEKDLRTFDAYGAILKIIDAHLLLRDLSPAERGGQEWTEAAGLYNEKFSALERTLKEEYSIMLKSHKIFQEV